MSGGGSWAFCLFSCIGGVKGYCMLTVRDKGHCENSIEMSINASRMQLFISGLQ